MRYFLILVTLIYTFSSLYSQKTQRYSGDFYNGMKIKGKASYSYYYDNNKKVKNGSFRYSAREKNETWRYSSSITGNYKSNLRNGKWLFNIESKDYEKSRDGYYYNISTTLKANYIDGKPNGKWYFKTIKSKHKKEKKQNHWRNVGDTIIENIVIKLNWNKGILTDSLVIINKEIEEIVAIMDNYGYIKSLSHSNKHNLIDIVSYRDSILEYHRIGNQTQVNYEYKAYLDLGGNESLIKKKKRSIIYSDNCKIDDYLEKYIFMNSQLLYSFIDGDLTLKKDRYNKYRLALKGMYYYDIKPILTIKENEIIKDIKIKHANIKHAKWLNERQLNKEPKNKILLADKRRLDNALSAYKNINCNIEAYKKFVSLHNTLNNTCVPIETSFKIETKIDFLEELKTIALKQYKILEINHQI